MKETSKWIRSVPLVFAAVAILLAAPSRALAAGGPGPHRGGPSRMMIKHRAELGLTDDQVRRLEAVDQSFLDRTSALRESTRTARRDLWKDLEADVVNRPEVEKRVDALSQDMARLKHEQIDSFLDAREILTPAQRQKMREIHKTMRREWRERRGK